MMIRIRAMVRAMLKLMSMSMIIPGSKRDRTDRRKKENNDKQNEKRRINKEQERERE
jgi:hypothetical protein